MVAVVANSRVLLNGIPSFSGNLYAVTTTSHCETNHEPDNSLNTGNYPRKYDYGVLMALTKTTDPKREIGYISRVNRR